MGANTHTFPGYIGETEAIYLVDSDAADEQLAGVLVRMWSLASGRRLPRGVRPADLSERELIEFWADDLTPVRGRHAASRDSW